MAHKYRICREINERVTQYITMTDIAKVMGCSRAALYNKCNGVQEVTINEAKRLADKYHVNVDEIIEWFIDDQNRANATSESSAESGAGDESLCILPQYGPRQDIHWLREADELPRPK